MNVEERKKIISNWMMLIERLHPQPICDYLVQVEFMGIEKMQRILLDSKTERGKSRELLTTLLQSGPRAFSMFVKALGIHQPDLALHLCGNIPVTNVDSHIDKPETKDVSSQTIDPLPDKPETKDVSSQTIDPLPDIIIC